MAILPDDINDVSGQNPDKGVKTIHDYIKYLRESLEFWGEGIKKKLDSISLSLTSLTDKDTDLEDAVLAVNIKADGLVSSVSDLTGTVDGLDTTVSSLNSKVSTLNSKVTTAQNTITGHTTSINGLKELIYKDANGDTVVKLNSKTVSNVTPNQYGAYNIGLTSANRVVYATAENVGGTVGYLAVPLLHQGKVYIKITSFTNAAVITTAVNITVYYI
jgi:hypothetical protein